MVRMFKTQGLERFSRYRREYVNHIHTLRLRCGQDVVTGDHSYPIGWRKKVSRGVALNS